MRVSELSRPSPERILKQVQAEESKRWGAKLKIFLGYAPGVGKSYRMLDEARRRFERGEDVVVGAVQGQQSEDVQALLRKLELIPPPQTPEGQAIDLDAILRRAPQVCVIDPLAARNPSGSRHPYRWQDVQELLRATGNSRKSPGRMFGDFARSSRGTPFATSGPLYRPCSLSPSKTA
jgi:two-component system sensor histidine kinase KdpD